MAEVPPLWVARWFTRVSLRRNYIYLDNPKAASLFVKSALLQAERDEGTLPLRADDNIHGRSIWDTDYDLGQGKFFVFSFVRNPFARALSAYLDKILSKNEPRQGTWRRFCSRYGVADDAKVGFRQFLEAIAGADPLEEDVHWGTQSRNLLNGALAIDCVGNVEHIEDDLRHIFGRVGIKYRQPAGADARQALGQNHATGAGSRLAEYYGKAERDLVIRKYAEDFERFGYGHDPWDAMPKHRRLSIPRTNGAGFKLVRAIELSTASRAWL